jgi:2-polyprenyl-6-hydroxyphenyl methylase/3-demethylubiquinone-9 3-methyltransferase
MKRPPFCNDWPESWKQSYSYDREEVWGDVSEYGYAYAYENRAEKTLQAVSTRLEKGSRILDIAGAQGNFSIRLAELGYQVTWNDLRFELEGYVRLKQGETKLDFAPGNAFELTFPELFDCVIITEIIEHVAHPDQFLVQVANLLKPGGYIVMTTPNGRYCINDLPRFSDCPNPEQFESQQFKPNSDGHIFLLWPDEIRSLAIAAGLTVESVELFTSPLLNGHMKLGKLLPILPKKLVQSIDRILASLPELISGKLSVQTIACYRKPEVAG